MTTKSITVCAATGFIIAGVAICVLNRGASRPSQSSGAVLAVGEAEAATNVDSTSGPTTPEAAAPGTRPTPLASSSSHPALKDNPRQDTGFATTASLNHALDTLVSSSTTFECKQAAWKQLIEGGKLDLAITELEQRAQANPSTAEIPAALGQAYLQKAGTIKDIREQGVLGLKADATFEAALNIDASNWDARFWKTTAMSYWPPQLGKGKEVIEQYLELVKQQEAQASQPQFAQTYVLLGEQYQKQEHPEYAREIWQRGVALFPENQALRAKVTDHGTAAVETQ